MTDQVVRIGRRAFLGGSALLAGAASAPALATTGHAFSSTLTAASVEPMYGPPPGVAKLNANEKKQFKNLDGNLFCCNGTY